MVGKVESNANLSPNWVGVGKIFKVNIRKFKLQNLFDGPCLHSGGPGASFDFHIVISGRGKY